MKRIKLKPCFVLRLKFGASGRAKYLSHLSQSGYPRQTASLRKALRFTSRKHAKWQLSALKSRSSYYAFWPVRINRWIWVDR